MTPTPPSEEARHGVEGLVADLGDLGAEAAVSDSFNGEPLAVEGVLVCVNGEALRAYPYGTEEEAIVAAGRIDPDDPSNVGTAIVEWAGSPRFWQRDRILVLYLGNDEATIDLLGQLLGEPFAAGAGRPQMLPSEC